MILAVLWAPWALGGYGEDEVARTIEGSSAEIGVILDAMDGEAAVQPEQARVDDNVTAQYLYRRGSVLVREQDIERVHDLLTDLGVRFEEAEEETVYRDRPRHPRSGVRPVIPGAARLVWSEGTSTRCLKSWTRSMPGSASARRGPITFS